MEVGGEVALGGEGGGGVADAAGELGLVAALFFDLVVDGVEVGLFHAVLQQRAAEVGGGVGGLLEALDLVGVAVDTVVVGVGVGREAVVADDAKSRPPFRRTHLVHESAHRGQVVHDVAAVEAVDG